jgi:hypothetical protein
MEMGTWQKNPTTRQLLNAEREEQIRREELQHQEHVELMDAFGQLQEKMSAWEEERETKRREHARQLEESEREGRQICNSLGKSSYQCCK